MSFIAEFALSPPVMQIAIDCAPNLRIKSIDQQSLPDGSWQFVFWASGGDFDKFEKGLPEDNTVKEYTLLTTAQESNLYRITFSEKGEQTLTYPLAAKYDIIFEDLIVTQMKSQIRAWMPDRRALLSYKDDCTKLDLEFNLRRLYKEEPMSADRQYGVTSPQREGLLHALDSGYFNVPRDSDLKSLAFELDISPQALSTRIRRGQRNLIKNALADQ